MTTLARFAVVLFMLFNSVTVFSFQEDSVATDRRLQNLRDLDSYFPFDPPVDNNQWRARSDQLRKHLQVSLGLWPMPTKSELNPVIHGKIDLGDYTVEKVYFESFPGFYVTGNLYRPKNLSGKAAGVLCPHGHHQHGRFRSASDQEIENEIKSGAEKFKPNAKSPLQARCAHLARMGCVVFHYDMLGYADSQQISMALAHGFSKQRPAMNTAHDWGLFSPRAESHLQSIMGLQTWNSIRSLDFLLSLPEVDPDRIGVTGASGGGTQTFILCALDDRPAVSMPVVMVSTAMQGGCTCENCSNLRIDTGNVEIAALFAPKPMGLVSADDWTKEMSTKGFPQLKQLYTLLGKPDNVMLSSRIEFPHNYNQVSRQAMYGWFNDHLMLNGKTSEEQIEFLTPDQLTVFDEQNPKPHSGDEFERKLLKHWHTDAQNILSHTLENDDLSAYFEIIKPALESVIGRSAASYKNQVSLVRKNATEYFELDFNVEPFTETVSCLELAVDPTASNDRVIIHVSADEMHSVYQKQKQSLRNLTDRGYRLVLPNLIGQSQQNPLTQSRWVNNNREAAGYAFGYNDTLFKQRVHDVMTIAIGLKNEGAKEITLMSDDSTSAVVIAAATQLDGIVDNLIVNTNGFRFQNVDNLRDPYFLPGGAKYGDIPGMLSACHKMNIWIEGESNESLSSLIHVRNKIEQNGRLNVSKMPNAESLVQWLDNK
jgi:dienelactone hydrolase